MISLWVIASAALPANASHFPIAIYQAKFDQPYIADCDNQIILKRRLQEARLTVEKYERLVNDETEKLQAGFSTVFVLLNFETTLISARLNLVNISKQYIQGIASLRALTGTLILINEDQYQINIANVLNYPGEDNCF